MIMRSYCKTMDIHFLMFYSQLFQHFSLRLQHVHSVHIINLITNYSRYIDALQL